MPEPTREALVLIPGDRYPESIEKLRHYVTVTQTLPPTLALIRFPPGHGTTIPDTPGIRFFIDDVPAEVADGLSAQEQYFVRAWQARRAPKERPGDQLPWDAPGYTPPG
jgi:hypothetical protein